MGRGDLQKQGFLITNQLPGCLFVRLGVAGEDFYDSVAKCQPVFRHRFLSQCLLQKLGHERGIPRGLFFGIDFGENSTKIRILRQDVLKGVVQQAVVDAGGKVLRFVGIEVV
jgi:hypothetical protein